MNTLKQCVCPGCDVLLRVIHNNTAPPSQWFLCARCYEARCTKFESKHQGVNEDEKRV